jgi:transposase-like protein
VARNPVQFQKGLSLGDFLARYGSEEQCHALLVELRWPDGFVCPRCGGGRHAVCGPRKLFQCSSCRHQTSVRAGTVFEASKLPLTKWFLAIYLMTQSKNDIAALELMRQLGVKYDTAWLLKQKLMGAMLERNRQHPLSGQVQIDDAYLGGEKKTNEGGRRGRGSPNKVPFVAAVATRDGKPTALHLRRVSGFTKEQIRLYAKSGLVPGARVVSDGLGCFAALAEAGFAHTIVKTGGGTRRPTEPALAWVNTVLGNVKSAISGTCRSLSSHHAARYLAAYEYRFNRRTDLQSMIPRLAYVALRQSPTPYHTIIAAETAG